jgi:hypothetical protein
MEVKLCLSTPGVKRDVLGGALMDSGRYARSAFDRESGGLMRQLDVRAADEAGGLLAAEEQFALNFKLVDEDFCLSVRGLLFVRPADGPLLFLCAPLFLDWELLNLCRHRLPRSS